MGPRSDKPGSLSFHCIAQRTDDRFEITAVSLEGERPFCALPGSQPPPKFRKAPVCSPKPCLRRADDVTLPAEGLAYSGPIYQDLDERVLDAFHHYLLARGINAKFVEYLQELAIDKARPRPSMLAAQGARCGCQRLLTCALAAALQEQREYTQWLKRVREFVVKN